MAKKQKKERKNRLKSLILLLFLTIVLLSTSTYAWFTANRSVSISPIDVEIAASSGLQISTNASSWKTLVTKQDLEDASDNGYSSAANQIPDELAPVSTIGEVSSGRLKMFKGEVAGDANNGGAMSLTASACPAEADGDSGDYIAFDVFLKVDDANGADIYLTNGSGVTVTSSTTDKGLQYAARYAFVLSPVAASNASAATAQALVPGGTSSVNSSLGGPVIIVEPNFDGHKASGVSNAATYYNITAHELASGDTEIDYRGVKAAIANPIELKNTNPGTGSTVDTTYASSFGTIPTLYRTNYAYSQAATTGVQSHKGVNGTKTTFTNEHYAKIFHLDAGITKARIYMWVEGQDIDCENAASGSFLTYKLGLTLDDVE